MKIGIDSYCYHRFFGEWYVGLQQDVGRRMSAFDFIDRAAELGVAGVSLESCFLPDDDAFVERVAQAIAARGLEPVWAWGHPDGLGSGARPQERDSLVRHLDIARRVGAGVMRICAGSRRTRPASWGEHRRALVELLRPLAEKAEAAGVVIAIENHIDLLAEEMLELVTTLDSPWIGVCLDTANNLRMFEDPVTVATMLAPYARATHVKDVRTRRGDPRTFGFWPSVPLGQGVVELAGVLQALREVNYGGLLAIEVDYLDPAWGEDEDAAVAQSVAWLREALELPPS